MEEHEKTLAFPPTFKGAGLVAEFGGIACYSNKKTAQIDGPSVTFEDGSTVDMQTRDIDHRGTGTILLKTLDESFVSEHTVTAD